jgi:hypothetical protein
MKLPGHLTLNGRPVRVCGAHMVRSLGAIVIIGLAAGVATAQQDPIAKCA